MLFSLKRMSLALAVFPFLLLLISHVSASYLSGEISIYENGLARFNVDTDLSFTIPGLSFSNNKLTGTTNSLTSKQTDVWTFSLPIPPNTNTLLEISLPSSLVSITSIKGADYLININDKKITILDSTSPNLEVSYKLKPSTSYSWLLWPLVILLLILALFLFKKIRKRKEHLQHVMPLVSDKEQKIIELLMKKPYRQKELRSLLNIPKASFTRYLLNLEKKKLIIREGDGKNKIVRLK